MQWALGRQLLYALGALIILGAVGFGIYGGYFYTPPSCTDGKQNQDETGIDCGGSCAALCTAPNVTVMWARSIEVTPGVYHAVAMLRNPNTGAAGSLSYEVSLFDSENILITRRTGMIDIAPGEVRTLFEPNFTTGERIPARTFVELTPGMFKKEERKLSPLRVLNWDFAEEERRLVAEIQNQGNTPITDATVTALLFNADGTLVNASQTHSGMLRSGQRANVVFTWPLPFSAPIERVDIVPRIIERQ